jgi:hypothetical protein
MPLMKRADSSGSSQPLAYPAKRQDRQTCLITCSVSVTDAKLAGLISYASIV